jgi:hypothetical protein
MTRRDIADPYDRPGLFGRAIPGFFNAEPGARNVVNAKLVGETMPDTLRRKAERLQELHARPEPILGMPARP